MSTGAVMVDTKKITIMAHRRRAPMISKKTPTMTRETRGTAMASLQRRRNLLCLQETRTILALPSTEEWVRRRSLTLPKRLLHWSNQGKISLLPMSSPILTSTTLGLIPAHSTHLSHSMRLGKIVRIELETKIVKAIAWTISTHWSWLKLAPGCGCLWWQDLQRGLH